MAGTSLISQGWAIADNDIQLEHTVSAPQFAALIPASVSLYSPRGSLKNIDPLAPEKHTIHCTFGPVPTSGNETLFDGVGSAVILNVGLRY